MELEGSGINVRYVTELRAQQWWVSRWLELRSSRKRPSGINLAGVNLAGVSLAGVSLASWKCSGAVGPGGPGKTVATLGYPSGCGQVVYVQDLFVAIAHPGAENFATPDGITCRIPAYQTVSDNHPVRTPTLVIGAGRPGDAWRDFVRYIEATRPTPSRMLFLVNDWYWKDKSQPLKALAALVETKKQSGVPIDTFTLDDGWDFDWDDTTKLWGRLNRQRFPGGWDAFAAIGRDADINISLWFGPIGGYSYRPRRIEFARTVDFEINGDRLCLCGPRYKQHVIESFSHWAAQGMDYIKVDGFWPDCPQADHGHVVGPAGGIAQMDGLIDIYAAWRKARPDLLIGYTSGSNPSPFWLQHADYLWRGGLDDSHSGAGTPFDRHNTYLDAILQKHRSTDMPMSAFVTFDIVQDRIRQTDDAALERGFWWLAARTSLHHDWYIQSSDLTLANWKLLARVSHWAKPHEKTFRFSRMIGGDPATGELYGFAAFDGQRGVLALRNPSDKTRHLVGDLNDWLSLPEASREEGREQRLELHGIFGETTDLQGPHAVNERIQITLAPLEIALFEVR